MVGDGVEVGDTEGTSDGNLDGDTLGDTNNSELGNGSGWVVISSFSKWI